MIMTLSVPLKIDSLVQIAQWVESCFEQWLLPVSKNFAVQLCCEEAFSNIVKYGVSEPRAEGFVSAAANFSLEYQQHQLQLIIEDPCEPFNPLEAAQPVVPTTLAEAKIGGLGIDLMKKFAQKIHYERKDFKNRLFFIFDLPSSNHAPELG
jgi:anti-sigma regulatory factor (Ser/Thr protein kinase)